MYARSNLLLSTALIALGSMCLPPVRAGAQAAKVAPAGHQDDLVVALADIEKTLDAKREELHVPGASLVIVKGDKILYIKGLGLKDVEHRLPVTPDTLFAIGSSTKAFTAMTVMMSAEEGKLKLTDSPKRYLSYFKLRDPEADNKITVSDLLCHRSGLPRTDLAMMTGVLNSKELIELLGHVKPTAKFGEKFQYQNLMFLTAGQIVAQVEHRPWTEVVTQRILKPLGMNASNLSVPTTLKAADHALGYSYDTDKKTYTHLPMRDISAVAPAGAINSNARDMAQWLRLMIGQGVFHGKRLISRQSYDQLITKHMAMAPTIGYGYGWMLHNWNGHKVAEHGGNIDGFNAEVAFMPDQQLGFVLLTNVSASSLGSIAMDTIWQDLVSGPKKQTAAGPAADAAQEVGTYHLEAANLDVKVAQENGKLKLTVPGQPVYTLENVGGRRYKIAEPPLPGYFATFRPQKGDPKQSEVEMEQPEGKFVLPKVKADAAANATQQADYNGPLKDLLGVYKDVKSPFTLNIAVNNGKVCMVVVGQPPYPLIESAKDTYKLGGAPDGFNAVIRRNGTGKVTGIHLQQPQGDLDLAPETKFVASITVDELMQKQIDALGGETNLRRHHSKVVELDMDLENQGVTAKSHVYAQAPDSATTDIVFYALGKQLLTEHVYFDGAHGGHEVSISPAQTLSDKEVAAARREADFYGVLNWKTLYKTVTIKRMDKVKGEDVYVVEMTSDDGDPTTDYISTKTFLLLKREMLIPVPGTEIKVPSSKVYSDYRTVDGEKAPFRVQEQSTMGDTVITVKQLRFDVPIPDSVFRPGKG
jgi:CubicO group peptidase (beta-lactamase class C family)